MASLKEIQSAIDERRLDTRQLNKSQLEALDQSFKSGDLKGYESIGEYKELIDLGAMSLAQEKEKRLSGLEGATGIDRQDIIMYGAAGAAAVPYMKNQQVLVDSFLKAGMKDVYGLDTRFAKMSEIYTDRLRPLKDALKKLPIIRRGFFGLPARMLGSVAGVVDDHYRFFKSLRAGAVVNPLVAADLGSTLLGAAGAAGGSAVYDIASLGTDFTAAMNQDMANLTDNDIRKLPFGQRMLYNALSEASNDFLWGGGALTLGPVIRAAGRGVKNSLGLNSAQSKAIAASAERLGIRPNIAMLIPGDNAFQNFFKKFFTTVGVYPLVSGPLSKFNKDFQKNLTQEQFLKLSENLNLTPAVNNSIMNYAGANEIKYQWIKLLAAQENEYAAFRDVYKAIGNPAFIPLNETKSATKQLLEELKVRYPQDKDIWSGLEQGAKDLTDADDSMVAYIKYLNSLGEGGTRYVDGNAVDIPKFLRISDWDGLSTMQTAAYSGSKYRNVNSQLITIRQGMERDLNSLNLAQNRDTLRQNIFKDEYNDILNSQGAQAAEEFIDQRIKYADLAFNQLKEANAFYALSLRPFEKSSVARKLRAVDSKLFADKGIDMTGVASIAPDEIFDKVIKRTLAGNSSMAIRELKQLLGVTDSSYKYVDPKTGKPTTVAIKSSPEAEAVWNAYRKAWFWDAWNNATEFKIRDLGGLTEQKIAAEAAAKGFTRPRWQMLQKDVEMRVRNKARVNETMDITEVDGRIFTQGNGIANLNEGLIKNHNFGEVFIDDFVQNLGLENSQGREKIIEMFGGGKTGEKALQRIQDIVAVKRSLDSVGFTDPSKFLQRSITLKGAGAVGSAGAGAVAASIGIGKTLKFLIGARIFGGFLTDPKLGESFMEMNKMYRFMSDDKNVRAITPAFMKRARINYARFINNIFESEGDSFRVDPDKINFEEIQQKLNKLDPNIPLTNKYDFSTMPKFTRNRIYPEYEVAKSLPLNKATQGDEFLQGANLIGLSEQRFEEIANGNPFKQSQPQVQAQPTMTQQVLQAPGQQPMTTGQTPQATEQRAATYQTLFPQDTLGAAIAAQGQQYNEGGLVQDAYAYADEVLNA